ncbi:MAG: hypothetical protein WDO24_14280 [Pseudomonadota bacterium]
MIELARAAGQLGALTLHAEGGAPPYRWAINGVPVATPALRTTALWQPDGPRLRPRHRDRRPQPLRHRRNPGQVAKRKDSPRSARRTQKGAAYAAVLPAVLTPPSSLRAKRSNPYVDGPRLARVNGHFLGSVRLRPYVRPVWCGRI